jgi:integrase
MACKLRWAEVDEREGVIDFERHKTDNDPEALYVIPLTPAVNELLKTMRARQKRDGVNSELVFTHGVTPGTGFAPYLGRPVTKNAVNTYLKRHLGRLGLTNGETEAAKIACNHGFRNTFARWAGNIAKFNKEYIDIQIGHKQKGENWMYFRGVDYLNHRRDMMTAWERYCLSSGKDAPAGNDVPFAREA